MSRNGSGTMTIINTMVAGTTITAAAHNENYDDIGDEITNSVAADGQTTMTGALKHASGSAAAPSLTFGADTNTGAFRGGENIWAIATDGVQRVEIGTATASFGVVIRAPDLPFPSGTRMLFQQTAAPTGWTKETSTYNDRALRVVTGAVSSGGSNPLSTASFTILQANLPSVTWPSSLSIAVNATGISISANSTGVTLANNITGFIGAGASGVAGGGQGTATANLTDPNHTHGIADPSHTHTLNGSVTSGGSGTAISLGIQYVDAIIAVKD